MSSHERLLELCGKCGRVYERLERFSRTSGTSRIASKAFDVIRIVPAFSSHEPLIFTVQSASVDRLIKMERHQVAVGAFLIIFKLLKKKKKSLPHFWMRKLCRVRENNSLVRDIDFFHFQNLVRMSSVDLEKLLTIIGSKITKQVTNFREPTPVSNRLAVTLRFLGTRDAYTSLQYLTKISKQKISEIVIQKDDHLRARGVPAKKDRIVLFLAFECLNMSNTCLNCSHRSARSVRSSKTL
ncbi:unnamed protein product [Bemisia tabaci]|uniref:Uncharacterized protein n=1 Tax=Bemisia tabaci TaxID=7038 RepID=A0A9P0F8D8_BEMTA|nr:unnamed protein product [Bemisia tabaci]